MNTINEQYTNDQKIQLYLNRVSDLFSQIKTWFKGELEVATDTIKVQETLGTYEVPTLSIREKVKKKSWSTSRQKVQVLF